MRGKRIKQIRAIVKALHGLVFTRDVEYDQLESVVMIKGWVNVDGKMVEKSVPIKAMGQRTHKKGTYKDRINSFKGLVKQGATP